MAHLLEELAARPALPSPRTARAIRLAAGVTQDRLAAELGVHRATVERWENGSRTPQRRHRDSYAALLIELQQVAR